MPGIALDLDYQVGCLKKMVGPYRDEYADNRAYAEGVAGGWGPGYGYIEAQALFGMVRALRPRQIIEVGAGVSTHVMMSALARNREEGRDGRFLSIEPYPTACLRQEQAGLLIEPVQSVAPEVFEALEADDLLFIDSSHTIKPGSDVNYLILEVLPRLRRGVVVHFHDITFPYDYGRRTLQTFLHWSESSLLWAFLIFNERVKILFSLSMLHYDRQADIKAVFPDYDPQPDRDGLVDELVRPFDAPSGHFPSSIYLRM